MRLLTSLLFCVIFFYSLSAQSAKKQTYWRYTNGQVATGNVKGLRPNLTADIMLRFVQVEKDDSGHINRTVLPYKPIELLVHKQDTLLIRVNIEGKDILLQSINKQVPNLFRAVNNSKEKRYYLKVQDTFHPIHHRFTRHLIVDEYLSHDEDFYVPKKLRGNYQAIEFAHSFENQLNPHSKRKHFLGRNRIGIHYNIGSRISPARPFYHRSWRNAKHFMQNMGLSLSYERQINQRLPWLYGQLQGRFLHFNIERPWLIPTEEPSFGFNSEPNNVLESINATNIYLYPGFLIELRQRHRLRPLLGAGLTLALPIKFHRHLTFDNIQGYPISQTLEHLQGASQGHFYELGLRYNLRRNFMLGLSYRTEHLEQKRRITDPLVIYSPYLPDQDDLAAPKQVFVQLQFQYSW